MTVGSLFAGIGGFDLAAERVGWEVKWQVEIDPFCRRVLEKHWPQVRRYEDVRTVGSEIERVDVLCGGFPCQPHSTAGRRLGAADDRDLWPQFRRLIRELKPEWVVAENVSGLLSNGAGRFFGDVLRDLAESGYDAEWDCIPASAIGAPHQRDRVWIVAYPGRSGRHESPEGVAGKEALRRLGNSCQDMADAAGGTRQRSASRTSGHLAFCGEIGASEQWRVEPNVGRVAHGVSARVDRLRGLGNAIVPQIAEWIFRRIEEAEAAGAVDPVDGIVEGCPRASEASVSRSGSQKGSE